jgi:hypothetical protein
LALTVAVVTVNMIGERQYSSLSEKVRQYRGFDHRRALRLCG